VIPDLLIIIKSFSSVTDLIVTNLPVFSVNADAPDIDDAADVNENESNNEIEE